MLFREVRRLVVGQSRKVEETPSTELNLVSNQPGLGDLRVRVFTDIHDIDPADWDQLLGPDDVLMSHSFVRVCQEAQIENAQFWHLIVSEGHRIVAVATLHRMFVNLELLSEGLTRSLIRTLKQRWAGLLRIPVMFCGLPVSLGQSCLRISENANFGRVFE